MASMSPNGSAYESRPQTQAGNMSPTKGAGPKHVAFELVFPEPQYRARLPMRVQIYPHDTTESIVTTVKNFYGLYSSPTSSKGVSFEDLKGNTLIARYENFTDDMVVYVRVTEETSPTPAPFGSPAYNQTPAEGGYHRDPDPYPLQAAAHIGPELPRPSRSPRRRSISPEMDGAHGRRSASAISKKSRSRSARQRDPQTDIYSDSLNGYSSGDGAASTTSSSRAKEQLGNTEISVDNIVEGGRRKRAKFESSELPLFAPPQMPAATSNPSVSPARRIEHQRPSLPSVQAAQNPFTNPRPLQSPQSYNGGTGYNNGFYATPVSDHRRSRGSIGYSYPGANSNGGILPTPDPTVGSCMSEEDKDVALQLMRLGDMSNISHGRTSASTLDDTFSGRADAASSTGATSNGESDSEEEYEDEDDMPEARRQKLDAAGAMRKIYQTTESHFVPPKPTIEAGKTDSGAAERAVGETKNADGEAKFKVPGARTSLPDVARPSNKPMFSSPSMKTNKASKNQKGARPPGAAKSKKADAATGGGPMSPASMPPSRKQSVASGTALSANGGDDDQVDLSAKPRCQRCRKSKKGCDRQRPCGRCRDAGLSADQCISEDEGNGRKGRYGRHMGVSIKKEEVTVPAQPSLLPAAPISMADGASADKNKKRKR